MRPTVLWRGDNVKDVERLLAGYLVRADREGEKLLVRGLGINVTLEPGDTLILDRDERALGRRFPRVGIQRAPTKGRPAELFVTWKGDNVAEIGRFVSAYQVELMVVGENLHLIGKAETIVLKRGDRVLERNGQLVISVAGKTHRA
jgi:hypothetical protein